MTIMIIKTYTVTDFKTAYLLISTIFCPMLQSESEQVKYDFIKFIKKELDNYQPDRNIVRKPVAEIYEAWRK